MYPQIVQVVPNKDYSVYVYFADGKIVRYDLKPLLDSEVFSPLRDMSTFMDRCTILNDTLAWDIGGNRDATKSIDIAPDTLYEMKGIQEQFIV